MSTDFEKVGCDISKKVRILRSSIRDKYLHVYHKDRRPNSYCGWFLTSYKCEHCNYEMTDKEKTTYNMWEFNHP